MASEWPRVTIESLIESGAIAGHKDGNHGSQYPRVEEFGAIGVPFLTAKSLTDGKVDIDGAPRLADERADRLRLGFVKPGDVLLSHNATVGRVAIMPDFKGRILIGTSLTYFRLNPSQINPRYLAAYFSGTDFQNQLAAVMSQTTRNQVPITSQRRLTIVLPPLDEQKAIAAVLGPLDDKIELNRRMNATLEAMPRALFQSWFVDFDPVRAKQEGRPPAGLHDPTAALFPDSFDGEIPKGWKLAQIGNFADFQNGYAFKSKDWQTKGMPVVKIGSVKPGIVDLCDCSYIAPSSVDGLERFRLSPGDILVGMTGYPGEVGMVPLVDPAPYLNQRVGRVSPKDGASHFYSWIHQNLRQPAFKAFAENRAHGSAQANVSAGALMEFPVVFPGDEIIHAFETLCRPLIDRILRNNAESSALARVRDELLPKLLNGDLTGRPSELITDHQ
jgi:type I restriction enzyme S subunit